MRAVCLAVCAIFLTIARARANDAEAWLPVTRSDVDAIAARALHIEGLKSVSIVLPANQRDGLAPGDTVWGILGEKRPLGIVMAGEGERIHTIHIYFPIVNESETQSREAIKLMDALFARVYPDWPGAQTWPQDSLGASWNGSPLVTHTVPTDPNDLIIRKTLGGITSSTVGVPPDLVVYSITTRARCVPDAKRENPFQRAVC